MHETYLVIETIKELMRRGCNGYARLEIGRMISDVGVFKNIFDHFTYGTSLQPELDIEEIPVVIKCECGYKGEVNLPRGVTSARCPECHRVPQIVRGKEFRILKPE